MKQPYHGRPATPPRPQATSPIKPLRRFGILLLTALGLASAAQGQQRPAPNFFAPDAAARTAAAASPLAASLRLAQTQALTLDAPSLRAALATAPPEGRAGAAPLVLALPRPDGRSARFALREAPIMEAPLAARYPQIRTYAGIGLDDVTATVRLDISPQGFHAQVLSGTGPGFDIDPASPTDLRHYLSYDRHDLPAATTGQAARCGLATTPADALASAARVAAWRAGGGAAARLSGAQVRNYRLALTCTPEYSIIKGNTTASVLAAEVATLNRVVGVFEREVAVRFVLVANNDQLIFLSGTGPQPVPTLTNGNKFAMLGENQANVDRIIGNANYDMGHILCTSGGGVASLNALCDDGYKAQGVSADDVKTICHEMGHQLGATHTFNTDDRNRNGGTAWEPGSGSTFMSYSGLFGPADDVQGRCDDVFHTGSYDQMQGLISYRGCGTSTATGNLAPVVTAPASGKTLPFGTPFKLTATATDANNDPLTYSWEELDLGPAGNLTMTQLTGQTPPLFRSWLPTTTPTRYFPRLNELVNNTTAPGERLPTVARTLTFRCTARDVHDGLVGVVGGVDYSALVTLSVSAAAGPFVLTAPNAAGTNWAGGSTQTVTWDVANTTAAPVSCARVNLRLSLDGGLSYPFTLATGVANDGSADVTVPSVASTTARLMVEAADNYFFDLSNANFTITPGPGPVISSFTPVRGPVGTVVTLTGLNFTGATAVRFNGTATASFTVVSATSLTATVAAGSSSGLITVSTPTGTGSSTTSFLVGAPPTISSFTPASGPVATIVTLTGTGFVGATQVTLNGATVPDFFINSATQLTLTVPDRATTGLLAVTTPLGTGTSATVFTVPLRPTIASFTPTRGPVGTVVTLTGTNLAGATAVSFNGANAPVFTVNSATSITATVPAGATTGPLAVTTPLGVGVSGNAFTVIPPPTLTLLSPATGVVGTVLALTGTDLSGTSAVTFTSAGGTATPAPAGYVVASGTRITGVRVPATLAAGTYALSITAPSGPSNGLPFVVLPFVVGPAPTIVSFVRTSGTVGATIRLTGTGLSNTTQITFSGSSGNMVNDGFVVNAAGTEITGLVVPAGAVTGPLTATTPNGTSAPSPLPFTVNALPVALSQNVTLTLDANGSATLAATAVNAASTANGGLAAASELSVSATTFSCADVRPAQAASALRFNGSGQYIEVLNRAAAVPVGNSPYTIEAWIKPTTMGNYGIIGWGAYGGGSAVNALRLKPTGLVNYWWGNDFELTTASLAGAWHHVAATCDGTTRTLYLDGVAIGSDRPGTHYVPDARNLRIGSTNGGEYFNGLIDEVRVWNVARTAGQLSAGRGLVLPANSAGLLAYYRLGEGSGLTTADATGTAANTGTLAGGPSWSTDAPPLVTGVPVTLTVTDADGNTSTVPAAVTVAVPATPLTTWNGSQSTDATACQNWSYGKLPDAATSVVIPAGMTRYPSLTTGTQPVQSLTIATGGRLTLGSGATLELNGDFTNDGTATLAGSVQLVGSAPLQTLGGSAATPFATLVVNKPAGTVQLARELAIGTALTMTSGTLSTGAYQVALGDAATLTETNQSYVHGTVETARLLSTPAANAFGGLGLTLTPGGATLPGRTLVRRVTGAALAGVNAGASVLRYFDIQPAVNAGLSVTLDFAYFDHELNGLPAASLGLFKAETSTAGPWVSQSPVTRGANTVRKTGIADFSLWTLATAGAPLPVELTSFTATAAGPAVRLAWATASERNSLRFDIERSEDGRAFDQVGQVAAQGTKTSPTTYTYLDNSLLHSFTHSLYYRLRQVDRDGTFSYSPVRAVTLDPQPSGGLTLVPNPAPDHASTLAGAEAGAAVTVFDALGRRVLAARADATGRVALVLPAGLPTGVYVVRSGLRAVRLVVE